MPLFPLSSCQVIFQSSHALGDRSGGYQTKSSALGGAEHEVEVPAERVCKAEDPATAPVLSEMATMTCCDDGCGKLGTFQSHDHVLPVM